MLETNGTNPIESNAGNTNTTTSNNESGSGKTTRRKSTTSGKQDQEVSKSNLVEQGSPAEVTVSINTDLSADKTTVPKLRKKPTKKKQPPKEKTDLEKAKDLQGLLEGVFLVASLKAGSHWQLSSDESKQIAVPLSKILDRYDLLNKASEVSDPVALIVACATIVFPRIMVTQLTAKEKKNETLKKNGVITNDEKGSIASVSGQHSRGNETTTSADDGQFIKSLHTEI